MAGVKNAYYRDGDARDLIYRQEIYDDYEIAYLWNYKREKWVPYGPAWEEIDNQEKTWGLDEEYVNTYIQRMVDEFPDDKERDFKPDPKGAKRKRKHW